MNHFYDVIDNLSMEEKEAVYEILSLEPGKIYPLDSISIDKLKLMSMAAKLSFEQKPLIEIVNKGGYQIVWGRKFPEALHDRIKSELNG
jgi:ribosomal protein S3AE